MPDTFKILHESFSEPAPQTEDDGFQDFNALSRIAASEPTAEPPTSRPVSADKSVLSRQAGEQAPPIAAQPYVAPAQEAFKPVAERAQPTFSRPAPQAQTELPPVPHTAPVSHVAPSEIGWRELPLADLFSRLRSRASNVGEPSRRLHGMFRR